MAFVRDNEDTNSICMTAVANLLEKYNIDPKDVGRLEGEGAWGAGAPARELNFRPRRRLPQWALRA